MSEHIYRRAFAVAIVICVVLVGVLAYVILRPIRTSTTLDHSDPVVAKGPDVANQPMATPSKNTESGSTTVLSPVQLSPQRLQAIGVTIATVESRTVNDELRVPGDVEVNEQQLSYVQTRFPGWIQKVFANATYQYVHKGEPLFTVYSPELVSTEQEYVLAKQNQKTFIEDMHGTASKEGGWLLQAAADRLRQFGIPQREVESLEKDGQVQQDIEIDSPVSGYVTERNALPNQYVQAETKLYTIADLSSVWVYANVYQTDVGRLKPGDRAVVSVDAYPGRQFTGRIDQILPQVDPVTRTVRVRLVFSNPGLLLKPGMFVNVTVGVSLGRQIVIPASGVLQAGIRQIAFIDRGQGYLEPREVEVGPRIDDHVVVIKGLSSGERIVSSANFLVDSEAQLQAAIGSFAAPPPGTGAAAVMNASPPQSSIDFSTEPSPPHKGSNVVRVKLTGADGKPISGAQVTVTFVMPAMPEMGMAAMREAAMAADKGNGRYEGQVQLRSGGAWQVTVTAQRGAQTIATKQLSVNATGGM